MQVHSPLAPRPAAQRGNTWLGFLIGLVTGLGLAAIVAVVITQAPVPFVERVKRPTENVNPGADGKLPDPNKPLYSTPPGGAPAAPAEVAKADAPAKDVGKTAAADAGKDAKGAAKGEAKGEAKADAKADAKGEDSARFLLQAGAYKTAEDADAMRARLAMLGLEAKVTPVDSGGSTLYRVRLGPYGERAEIERIRKQLADNGIGTQVIPQR